MGGEIEYCVGQCLKCKGRVWLKPLGDETFSFCQEHGETEEDIILERGISPAIDRYLNQGVFCDKFCEGESVSEASKEDPFVLHPLREQGERRLLGKRFFQGNPQRQQ